MTQESSPSLDVSFTFFWILCASGLVWMLFREKRKLPPGPKRYPLVGSFYAINFPLSLEFKDHYDRYGDISCVKNGLNTLTVVLNSARAIREALINQGEVFAGRPRHFFSTLLFDNSGLVMSDGVTWKKHRRFSLKTLRDFGFARNVSEQVITREAAELCETLGKCGGKAAVDPQKMVTTSVCNVICHLIFSQRLASEDSQFEKKLELINSLTQDVGKHSIITAVLIPMVTRVFPSFITKNPIFRRAQNLVQSLLEYCQIIIDEKKKNFSLNEEPRDYVEAYLCERARLGPSEAAEFSDLRLTVSIFDLFLAGTETTSNSLRWMLYVLAKSPELQERLYHQVQSVLGNRSPAMSDKKSLSLIEAFVDECQRMYSLVPLAVTHRLLQDTTLLGYELPEGCNVVPNLRQVHFDSTIFPNPKEFLIDRFLDDQGNYKPSENVIPFGIGKRSCLGEGLARMELFLFVATLIQQFNVKFETDVTNTTLEQIAVGTFGTVNAPNPYKIIFEHR